LIVNRNKLENFHKDRSSRLILSAFETALKSVKPQQLLSQAIRYGKKQLTVRDIYGKVTKLQGFDHVFIVGAGKATAGMANALCSILGNRIAGGAITIPYGANVEINGIQVTQASHPIPNQAGVKGTHRILSVLKKVECNDLVIVLISGGGSALMPLPAPGISLADKQRITALLLRSGASIHEINAVRKHLSAIKGGQLLRQMNKSCKVLSLILSDVIGDDLDIIASGPTYPDSSTFGDALKVLRRYRIRTPYAASKLIANGVEGKIDETPKPQDQLFSRVKNILIGNNATACKAAAKYLNNHGIEAIHLGSEYDGEARDFGAFLSTLSLGFDRQHFAIVAGGETTVKLDKNKNGRGGRNQETAVACLANLKRQNIAVGCIGTDGIDGNSDAAGALVSPKTIVLSKKVNLQRYLENHDSYNALKKLNSLIFTGYTGTNVNDISICMS